MPPTSLCRIVDFTAVPPSARKYIYIARGMTAKEIARELTHVEPGSPIIDRTVEVHKGNIKRKFRLDSANALITFAIEYCQDHRIDYREMLLRTKRTSP